MSEFTSVSSIAPSPRASIKLNLYQRLEQKVSVKKIVDNFYDRFYRDERLAFFFRHVRLSVLRLHQVKFINFAFNRDHSSSSIESVSAFLIGKHKHLFQCGLDEDHFDIVCQHLVASLEYVGVASDLIEEARGIIEPLRPIFATGARKYGPPSKKPVENDIASAVEKLVRRRSSKGHQQQQTSSLVKQGSEHWAPMTLLPKSA